MRATLWEAVRVGVGGEQAQAAHRQTDLLPQLPPERVDRRLADLDLPAGELPLSREGAPALPPNHEYAPAVQEEGHDDRDRDALHGTGIAANG